jgi:hypothetical protein
MPSDLAKQLAEYELPREKIEAALDMVRTELYKAFAKHGMKFASPHEGHSVIREELDPELWAHVCGDTGRTEAAGKEACQVAAMAVKYMVNFDPRLGDGSL